MASAFINGQIINYEIKGNRDFRLRTPALLLHGNGEDMSTFFKLVSLLPQRGFVLMDSRYQGGSIPEDGADEPKITYDLMADDALKLMEDELGISEYDIIGFSDGAITALKMALSSIHVRKLILIGVNSDPSGLKPKMQRLIKKDHAEALRQKNRVEAELCRMMLEEPRLTSQTLANIICETTVIYGKNDEAINRKHSQAIADAIPRGSFTVINGAAHDVLATHSNEVAELVRALL